MAYTLLLLHVLPLAACLPCPDHVVTSIVAGCCLHNVNDAARLLEPLLACLCPCRGSFHAVCKKQMSNNSGQQQATAGWQHVARRERQWTHCIQPVLNCFAVSLPLPFIFICILFQFGGIIKCFRCGRWRARVERSSSSSCSSSRSIPKDNAMLLLLLLRYAYLRRCTCTKCQGRGREQAGRMCGVWDELLHELGHA